MNVEYLYVDSYNPPQEYLDMLQKWHGHEKWDRFKKRQFEWYQRYPNYKIFAVKVEGVFVGQASAFGVDYYYDGKMNELWWGVDTFLFKEYRGGGIGKQLQKQLHDDLPNFTSAAYTPINGIIKKKCGCIPLFDRNTWYYGVSNFFTLMVSIAVEKKFKENFPMRSVAANQYLWFKRKNYKGYEISDAVIDEKLVAFVNETLKERYDFFVWRNVDYMKWKYEQNPAFDYKLMTFSKNGMLEAVVGFTDIHQYGLGGKKVMSVKVLDSVISKYSELSTEDLLVYIADYYKKRNEKIDGIFSLQKSEWYPRTCVTRPVLSTIRAEIKQPYITYLDQDMEQEM